MNAFVSGNTRLAANTLNHSTRISADTSAQTNATLQQDGDYLFQRQGMQAGIGFDWAYKKKNKFSAAINYDNFSNSGHGSIYQEQMIKEAGGMGSILLDDASVNKRTSSNHEHSTDINASYTRSFNKDDQELDISFTQSFDYNFAAATNQQLSLPGDSLFQGANSTNPGKERETEWALDYTQPIKENVMLGIGGKVNYYQFTNTAEVLSFQPGPKSYTYDSALSNYLDYQQHVYALYSEISFPVGKLFNTKLGGRYERTEISSYYSNAQHQSRAPGYNTLVPSVFFSKKISEHQTIKLSYSKRIERPDHEDLNPFINTSDPKNITAGNPYLQPEIGHRFELGYIRQFNNAGSFMITLFYRANNHDIQSYVVYYPVYEVGDSVYTNVAVTTRQNIGLEKNVGINIFNDLHLHSRLDIRTNLFLFFRHILNAVDPGFDNRSFNYRLHVNADYRFNDDLVAEFFGHFNSPRHNIQGSYPSFFTYSIALRKQFLNKKVSLALTATNPFNKYVDQRTVLTGSDFTVSGLRRIPFRSIGINFTWKFGKLESRDQKDEQPDANLSGAPTQL